MTVPEINAKAQRRRDAKELVPISSVRESPTGRTAGDSESPITGEKADVVGNELPPPSAFSPAPRLRRVGSAWVFLMMWIRRVGDGADLANRHFERIDIPNALLGEDARHATVSIRASTMWEPGTSAAHSVTGPRTFVPPVNSKLRTQNSKPVTGSAGYMVSAISAFCTWRRFSASS